MTTATGSGGQDEAVESAARSRRALVISAVAGVATAIVILGVAVALFFRFRRVSSREIVPIHGRRGPAPG